MLCEPRSGGDEAGAGWGGARGRRRGWVGGCGSHCPHDPIACWAGMRPGSENSRDLRALMNRIVPSDAAPRRRGHQRYRAPERPAGAAGSVHQGWAGSSPGCASHQYYNRYLLSTWGRRTIGSYFLSVKGANDVQSILWWPDRPAGKRWSVSGPDAPSSRGESVSGSDAPSPPR